MIRLEATGVISNVAAPEVEEWLASEAARSR